MARTGQVYCCVGVTALFLVVALAVGAKIDLDSVVGMWLLDEESGAEARDASGHEHHGKHQGGVEVIDAKFGKGLELFGAGESIVIPGLGAAFPAVSVTIMFYAHVDEWKSFHLFSMPVSGQLVQALTVAGENMIHFHCGDLNQAGLIPAKQGNWLDRWAHLAFVKHFSEEQKERYLAFYVDGVRAHRVGRISSVVNETDGDFTFGGDGTYDGGLGRARHLCGGPERRRDQGHRRSWPRIRRPRR